MAWNEPGDNKNRDPWNNNGNRGNGGPPDLDEIIKKFLYNLSGLFGGKKRGAGGGGNKGSAAGGISLSVIVASLAVVWALSGIYIIDESERGVVLTLGEYTETTTPGPHWHARFIQTVEKVNVATNRQIFDQGRMLTEDENIAEIEFSVQFIINDPAKFLFNLRDNSEATVVQASRAAIREIIGKNNLDYVITDGRNEIAERSGELLQTILDDYDSGIRVNLFNLTKSAAPQQVQGAFDDATKAREDRVRFINEAQAYSNEIIPLARGEATRLIEEAKAYKVSVVERAIGEADRFNALLTEYSKAPEVTRERLYLDTVESVLNSSTKIMMDVEGGNNIMYLPLDQIMQRSNNRVDTNTSQSSIPLSAADQSFGASSNSLRARESR